MLDKKKDKLLDSAYDGIQEYDNDLPLWWIYLFYLTIAVGLVYAFYVHLTASLTDHERLQAEMKALKAQQVAYAAKNAPVEKGPETLLALSRDPVHVAKGKEVYQLRCLACHGAKAEGLVGPNLTDEYWIHGGQIENIHHVIEVGVPEKGMLTWKNVIPQDAIDDVTAFLWTIRNTNVPGKAPQGEKR